MRFAVHKGQQYKMSPQGSGRVPLRVVDLRGCNKEEHDIFLQHQVMIQWALALALQLSWCRSLCTPNIACAHARPTRRAASVCSPCAHVLLEH